MTHLPRSLREALAALNGRGRRTLRPHLVLAGTAGHVVLWFYDIPLVTYLPDGLVLQVRGHRWRDVARLLREVTDGRVRDWVVHHPCGATTHFQDGMLLEQDSARRF